MPLMPMPPMPTKWIWYGGCTGPADHQIRLAVSGCHVIEKRFHLGVDACFIVSRFYLILIRGPGLMDDPDFYTLLNARQGIHHCQIDGMGALAAAHDQNRK
jgi:hypothetical protein